MAVKLNWAKILRFKEFSCASEKLMARFRSARNFLIIFFIFINFANNTLHYIKRQEQDLHNEIQYITTAGFPQQRIANYCGPDTKIFK